MIDHTVRRLHTHHPYSNELSPSQNSVLNCPSQVPISSPPSAYTDSARMEQLYNSIVDTLTDPILETAAMHVFDRWRSGEISRLSEIDEELRKEIEHYLRGEEAQKLLGTVVSSWLRPVAYELEEYTMPVLIEVCHL